MTARCRCLAIHGLVAAALAGCAGARATPRPPDPAQFEHLPALFPLLAGEPGPAGADSLAALEQRTGLTLTDSLADIAEDTAAHPLLRANAALLLGRRHPPERLIVYNGLLAARDERIRLAAVMALREYLPGRPESALRLLSRALDDPSPAVQARVLEVMADRDADRLRAYIERAASPELVRVARDLVMAAEQRGAPAQRGPDGSLTRDGPGGHRLVFTPRSSWPGWEAAAGRLEVRPAGGAPAVLGDAVEVSRDVVPAFFSPDGRFLVYEKERRIYVREVGTGAEREAGEGIAPRPLPFTGDFIWFRERPEARSETRDLVRLRYQALRASFADAAPPAPVPEGLVAVTVKLDVAGGASPLRWARVVEMDGEFTLRAEGVDPFILPDPFRSGG